MNGQGSQLMIRNTRHTRSFTSWKRESAGGRRPAAGGFTLIEVMVVCAIIGLILALGAPSLYRMMHKEGMRKAVDELKEVFQNARGRAILGGQTVMVEIRPTEQKFQIVGGGGAPAPAAVQDGFEAPPTPSQPAGGQISGSTLPEGITFEMLDINMLSFRESEFARIRFFPNGTCDECRLVIVGPNDDWRGIELENTTGVPAVVTDVDVMRMWGGL
jgi:prepilin-type N-terminal cleavage/methylation domain-containing protein